MDSISRISLSWLEGRDLEERELAFNCLHVFPVKIEKLIILQFIRSRNTVNRQRLSSVLFMLLNEFK